jgi:glycosyltransferase involved in cell wall biosynthesis
LLAKESVHIPHRPGSLTVAVLHLGSNGGGPKFTFELTRALRGAGFQTLAVIASGADNRSSFEALGPTLDLPTFTTPIGALLRAPLILLSALRLRRQLRRGHVGAVVIAMEQVWQAPLLRLSRSKGRRRLICVHDAAMHPGDHNVLEDVLRRLQRSEADGAITFSGHVADQLIASGAFPARRIWRTVHGAYGVAADRPHSPPSGDAVPTVGFFGRISEYKGLGLCYSAVEHMRASGRRVRFAVIGDGHRELVAEMTHPDDDVRLGWVNDSEIPATLGEFDVLALPYTESSQSGVFAYAISQGLPMAVTPVGGLREQAHDTGAALVATDVTSQAFAVALGRVLDDPSLYEDLAARGLRAARSVHSWDRVGEDAGRAIREMMATGGSR